MIRPGLSRLSVFLETRHAGVPKRAQIIKQALLAGELEVQELPSDHELSARSFPGHLKQRHYAVLRDFLTQRTVTNFEVDLKCPPEVVPFLFEAAQAINMAANKMKGSRPRSARTLFRRPRSPDARSAGRIS